MSKSIQEFGISQLFWSNINFLILISKAIPNQIQVLTLVTFFLNAM